MNRRGLIKAALPILAAPAIIRVAQLMPIRPERAPLMDAITYHFGALSFRHGENLAMVNPFTGQWEHLGGLKPGVRYQISMSPKGAIIREWEA